MTLSLPTYLMPRFIEREEVLYQEHSNHLSFNSNRKSISVTASNSYLVRKGDNLNSIAKAHNISLEQLKTWNGLETNFLIEGQRLVVTSKKELIPEPQKALQKNVLHQKSNRQINNYTVQHGDTLFKISRKFGNISIAELKTMNDLHNVNYLKPGTQLRIKN